MQRKKAHSIYSKEKETSQHILPPFLIIRRISFLKSQPNSWDQREITGNGKDYDPSAGAKRPHCTCPKNLQLIQTEAHNIATDKIKLNNENI